MKFGWVLKEMWVFVCGSHGVQKDKDFENWHFKPFKICLFFFVHFASQWLLSQSWAYSWMHRVESYGSSLSCEAFARDSWNSLPKIFKKLKFLENFESKREMAINIVFQHKKFDIFEKSFKNPSDKNHF